MGRRSRLYSVLRVSLLARSVHVGVDELPVGGGVSSVHNVALSCESVRMPRQGSWTSTVSRCRRFWRSPFLWQFWSSTAWESNHDSDYQALPPVPLMPRLYHLFSMPRLVHFKAQSSEGGAFARGDALG